MKNSKRDPIRAGLLAFTVLVFYAGFLSKAYVFEGLIRAMPIETGRWVHLLPGNYLLYGPLGLVFHSLLHALGIIQLAVISLQWMDALLGAVGVFVFYQTLRKLGGEVFDSAVWSGILAFSLGYWLWSTDAEDYILSTCLLLINFFFLVKYAKRENVDPTILGALHGLAILGHIVNAAFAVVILWVLMAMHGKDWLRPTRRYASAALIVALGTYAMVLALVRKPANATEAFKWFAGSAGVSTETIQFGGGWTAAKLWEWLKMSLHIWVSFNPNYSQPPAWSISASLLWIAVFLLGVFVLAFFIRFDEIYESHRAVVGGCIVWLGVYAAIFTRWQPWTMVYRVSDLVPMCTLLFLGYQSIPANRRIWQGAAVALVLCLWIGNLGAEIYPRSFASNNPHLGRMEFLKANTVEGDWITGDGGQDEIYIPYFAERRPIVVERFTGHPDDLRRFMDNLLDHGQNVFVTSRVRDTDEWKNFFSRYALRLKATDPNGFALYQVRSYHGNDARPKASAAS